MYLVRASCKKFDDIASCDEILKMAVPILKNLTWPTHPFKRVNKSILIKVENYKLQISLSPSENQYTKISRLLVNFFCGDHKWNDNEGLDVECREHGYNTCSTNTTKFFEIDLAIFIFVSKQNGLINNLLQLSVFQVIANHHF